MYSNYVFFQPHSRYFAFFFFLLASQMQNGKSRNGRRKKRRKNKTTYDRFAWTAVHRSCKVREYLNRLWISVHKKTFSRTKIDHTNSNYLLRYVRNYDCFNVGNKKFETKILIQDLQIRKWFGSVSVVNSAILKSFLVGKSLPPLGLSFFASSFCLEGKNKPYKFVFPFAPFRFNFRFTYIL